MVEKRSRRPAAVLRGAALLLVLATIFYLVWHSLARREDYTGGDVRTTGTVEAVHIQLGFLVAGRLAEVPAAEGETVKAGQLLARLESQDLEVQGKSAAAALEAAKAALAQARAARGLAQANRDRAARDWDRTRSLIQDEAIAPQQVDASRAAAEATAAQLMGAQAEEQAAEAQIHQAESAVAQASLLLSYAELYAPRTGVISEQIHRPGEMVTVGTPVISLSQVDTVKVRAAVDETRIGAVRPGDRVEVRIYTFDNKVFEGVVTDVQPEGDFATRKDWGAQRRDIRTFRVTARLPNPDQLLKDGMTAEVLIRVDPAVQKMVGASR